MILENLFNKKIEDLINVETYKRNIKDNRKD